MPTAYHSKLYAHELLRRCPSDSVERFTAALMDSQVDLNPHQVDAALFAFRSPLSKGAILADEVGLGKTIETGIVLSQKWAERKRKILIILPNHIKMRPDLITNPDQSINCFKGILHLYGFLKNVRPIITFNLYGFRHF